MIKLAPAHNNALAAAETAAMRDARPCPTTAAVAAIQYSGLLVKRGRRAELSRWLVSTLWRTLAGRYVRLHC